MQKKVVTRCRRDRTIHLEAVEGVLHYANRLHATGSEASAADCQQAEARLILCKDLDHTLLWAGAHGPQPVKIRRLKGRLRISVFLCG